MAAARGASKVSWAESLALAANTSEEEVLALASPAGAAAGSASAAAAAAGHVRRSSLAALRIDEALESPTERLESAIALAAYLAKSFGKHVAVVVPRLEELLLSLLESQRVSPVEDGSTHASGPPEASSPNQANGGASRAGAGGGDSIPRWAALLLRLTTKLNSVMAALAIEASWKARLSSAYKRLLREALCPSSTAGKAGPSPLTSPSAAGTAPAGQHTTHLPTVNETGGNPGPSAPTAPSNGAATAAALVLGLRRTLSQLGLQLQEGLEVGLPLNDRDAAEVFDWLCRDLLHLLPADDPKQRVTVTALGSSKGTAPAGTTPAAAGPAAAAAVLELRKDDEVAWAVASLLAAPAVSAAAGLPAEQAQRIALGACSALEASLAPLLLSGEDMSAAGLQQSNAGAPGEPVAQASDTSHPSRGLARAAAVSGGVPLPGAALVGAAAVVASRAAAGAVLAANAAANGSPSGSSPTKAGRRAAQTSTGSQAVERVADALLSVVEGCVAALLELGVVDPVSPRLLSTALAAGRQALRLVEDCVPSGALVLQDFHPRMQALLVESAQLAELEYHATRRGGQSGSAEDGATAKVQDIWWWDLSHDLSRRRPGKALGAPPTSRPARMLTRILTEATAALLAGAWGSPQRADVKGAFVPLASSATERQVLMLMLGRLLAIVRAEEEICYLVLPLLTDTLAAQTDDANAEVYAVAGHVLASIAVASAQHGRKWGYDTILDLLLKLYKFPQFSISRCLLHGQMKSQSGNTKLPAGGAVSAAPTSSSGGGSVPVAPRQPVVRVVGRCPGALAAALATIAEGVKEASLPFQRNLRLRLLALFSDFALILPNESYLADLGGLLPALASAVEELSLQDEPSNRSLSSVDMSLDALNSLQEEDLTVIRLFRHLWLYCAVYDFGGLQRRAAPSGGAPLPAWPPAWRDALGRVAAATPTLLLGIEQQRAEAVTERLQAEFGSRLAKLGPRGTAAALVAGLAGLVPVPQYAPQLPAPLAAHCIIVAAKGGCRAELAGFASREAAMPLTPVLAHLQLAAPGSPEFPWFRSTALKVFDVYISRLASERGYVDPQIADARSLSAELLAGLLISTTAAAPEGSELASLADSLLGRLLDSFPALQFRKEVLRSLFEAAGTPSAAVEIEAEEDQQEDSLVHQADLALPPNRQGLAWRWTLRLVSRIAQTAPGPAEALLAEHMRLLLGKSGPAAEVAGAYMPEVMAANRAARSKSALVELEGTYSGLLGWSAKLNYLGRVGGLGELAEAEGQPASGVALRCARGLADALRSRLPDRVLVERYLQAAAALVLHPTSAVAGELLRLLCWVPAKRFTPRLLEVARLCWCWAWAATGMEMQVTLLSEVSAAWLATVRAQRGLFAAAGGLSKLGTAGSAGSLTGGSPAGASPGGGINGGSSIDVEFAVEGIHAHHIWLAYLLEMWEVVRGDLSRLQAAAMDAYWQLLSGSLADPGLLCPHPASAGARFRLLLLALHYCRHAQGQQPGGSSSSSLKGGCPAHIALLYERVLRVALGWFEVAPAWHAGTPGLTREAAAAVRDFAAGVEGLAVWPTLPPEAVQGGRHPVWGALQPGANGLQEAGNAGRRELLRVLLSTELERLAAWSDPLGGSSSTAQPSLQTALLPDQWVRLVRTAWGVAPRLAVMLQSRYPAVVAIRAELERLVTAHAAEPALHAVPEAVTLLATPAAAAAQAPALAQLASWAPAPLLLCMSLLCTPAGRHPAVMSYLMRSLDACDPEEVAFFLPQLVQMLRADKQGMLEHFLLAAAGRSVYFAHLLVCQLTSEGTPPDEAFRPLVKRSGWAPPMDTGLWRVADEVKARLLAELHGPVREHLEAELGFFDEVTAVSGKLYPVPKDERKAAAVKILQEIKPPRSDLYLPTNPHARVVGLVPEGAAPMQSAAKCPILVPFDVEESLEGGAEAVEKRQALIFKVGDDCRQDVLALQVIDLFQREFRKAGLELFLAPYGVVPTAYECGIIEVVANSKSRAQLGELTDGGLFEIFQHEFGLPGSKRFEAARLNLLKSCAGYAVASYILQAKDRHNGNILVDNKGHLVHIDFGFILGISPGGNLGFESAAFKLSYEMTELLDPGRRRTSETFRRFEELCVRGFLAARNVADGVVATVAMMVPSQLPCFSRGNPVQDLKNRFHLELSPAQAAAFMRGLINDAYDKWTTGFYDYVQYLQQGIAK